MDRDGAIDIAFSSPGRALLRIIPTSSDPTGMTTPTDLVVIARGRDAGDVPWCQIQSGPAEVSPPRVNVSILEGDAQPAASKSYP